MKFHGISLREKVQSAKPIMWVRGIEQVIKDLLCKQEKLSSIPRTHILKGWVWWRALGRQRQMVIQASLASQPSLLQD